MRVVLDTNVIVSLLLWKGALDALRSRLNRRALVPCFTPDTISELLRVASYPRIRRQADRMSVDLRSLVTRLIEAGAIVKPVEIPRTIPEDASDEMFLACAVAARADFIISGDRHLQRIKVFCGIPILSPRAFEDLLKRHRF